MKAKKLEEVLEQKLDLGIFPTAIQRMKNFEKELDYSPIFIKRDDLTGLGPGGNKVRSLEYILKQAEKENADRIIASGPLQSNLCTIAACACNKLQIPCILVHNGEKPKELVSNILLNHLSDVESHYLGAVDQYARADYVDSLFSKLEVEGHIPFIIRNGASTGHGALGYVNAIHELMEQKKEGYEINEIFAPGGNGGVAAGLIYGNAVFGLPFKVNIISVEYDKEELSAYILDIISEIVEITGIAFDYNLDDVCKIIDDYMGAGWGENTAESAEMVYKFAQTEGIFVENVYTSKVVVGMLDMIKKNNTQGGVCFIHTGGFSSIFSQY